MNDNTNIIQDLQIRIAELENQVEFYQTFISNSPTAVFLVNSQARYTYINPSACKLLGYSSSEMLEMSIPDIVPPERLTDALNNFLEINEKGESFNFEIQLKRKNNTLIDVLLDGIKLSDNEFIAYVKDVSKLKKTELKLKNQIEEFAALSEEYISTIDSLERAKERLELSEKRYKSAQAIAQIGSWEYNIENNTFWGSDEGKRIYGFDLDAKNFTADQVMRCVVDPARVDQAMIDLITQNKPYNIIFEIIPKNSDFKRVIHSVAELVKDAKGNPIRVIGVMRDITDQVKAEKQLIAAKEHAERNGLKFKKQFNFTKALTTYLPIPLFYIDKEGRYLGCNPAFEIFTGKKENEIIGYSVSELWQSSWANDFHIKDIELINNGTEYDSHLFTLRNAQKQIRDVVTHKAVFFDENGNPAGIVGVFIDITEQKQNELLVRQSADRLNILHDLNLMSYIETIDIYDFALEKAIELCRSKIGFLGFLNDDESIVTIHAWSASVSKICEVKEKYIDFEVANTGIWGEVVHQRKSIIINDFTADNPLKRGVPQGHVSVTNYLSIPIFDNNKIVAIVAVGNKDDDYNDTDMQELSLLMQGTWTIMKQRKNEKELFDSKIRAEESEEKHRFLFENMIQGVVYHCSTGEIIYANEAASRILGLSEDQLYGKTSFDPRWRAIHEDGSDFPGETHPGMITLSTGQPVYNTIMGVFDYHNNSYRWININSIPKFKNNENKPSQVIVTFEDITELKTIAIELNKAKVKAEESDRLKSAFLQNMSHEIRTPLNAICGFSERLTLPNLDNQKLKFYTNIIITSSNQLLSIVNDVLTISALETKQERLNIEKVYLNSVISELKTIFTQEADKKNIALVSTHNLPASVSQVYADKSKIIQILSNLIANSLKFIKHGTIEFGYCKKGNELEFFVSDTGIGIDRSKFDLIFNRFTQADDTIQADYGGTGLGLSICKGFVELMGGRIWVESELGNGSTFYFSVPYNPVEVVTEHNVNQPIISGSIDGFSILVAEDQEYNFLYVEEFLSQMNCHVVHAKNGSKAVEICKNNPSIALVLMDIKMPVMDGYTAAKLIKEFRPNLPIIALTAYALELEVKKYSNAFTDYITKPITQATLLKAISPYFTTE